MRIEGKSLIMILPTGDWSYVTDQAPAYLAPIDEKIDLLPTVSAEEVLDISGEDATEVRLCECGHEVKTGEMRSVLTF